MAEHGIELEFLGIVLIVRGHRLPSWSPIFSATLSNINTR
jgi:hypothetical protein